MVKIVAISDTHCKLNKLKIPEGDMLIHSGDLTYRGTLKEISKELTILEKYRKNFKDIVIICGNHDFLGETEAGLMAELCRERGITYLNHASIILQGIKIFGSPYTPYFHNWAFNVHRGEPLRQKWNDIPLGCDVVVTHGPPMGILDLAPYTNEHVGCEELFKKLQEVKPKLHIFGHIHHDYGIYKYWETTFVNASICNEKYEPINKPIEIDL